MDSENYGKCSAIAGVEVYGCDETNRRQYRYTTVIEYEPGWHVCVDQMDDTDVQRQYVPNKDYWSIQNAESSYLMGERNEGQYSDSAEEEDDMHAKSQNEGVATEQKGKNKMVWIPWILDLFV